MSMTEKLWDALTTVIKMNDKVIAAAARLDTQQTRLEDLTARVIRLETALELGMAVQARRALPGGSE